MSRSGDRAFNRCQVKKVTFTDYVYPSGIKLVKDKDVNPVDESARRLKTPAAKVAESFQWAYGGSRAELHCPKTEFDDLTAQSQYTNHNGRERALESLRRVNADLLCRYCRFSSMGPVQVAEERVVLTQAEADQTLALAALEHARKELRAVAPGAFPIPLEAPQS